MKSEISLFGANLPCYVALDLRFSSVFFSPHCNVAWRRTPSDPAAKPSADKSPASKQPGVVVVDLTHSTPHRFMFNIADGGEWTREPLFPRLVASNRNCSPRCIAQFPPRLHRAAHALANGGTGRDTVGTHQWDLASEARLLAHRRHRSVSFARICSRRPGVCWREFHKRLPRVASHLLQLECGSFP